MTKYQAVRISINNRPTYGDIYAIIEGNYKYNDIVDFGNEKFLILFEME